MVPMKYTWEGWAPPKDAEQRRPHPTDLPHPVARLAAAMETPRLLGLTLRPSPTGPCLPQQAGGSQCGQQKHRLLLKAWARNRHPGPSADLHLLKQAPDQARHGVERQRLLSSGQTRRRPLVPTPLSCPVPS